jgi:hypothetical protein
MARKKRFTEAELLAQIAEADARTAEEDRTEPRARAATFDPATRRVRIELKNGCAYEFPADLGQGLRGASAEDLAQIEVFPGGIGLRWDTLDVDLSVTGLVFGVFGTRAWMRQLESEMAGDDSAAGAIPKAEPGQSGATRRRPSRSRKAEPDPAVAA